MRKFLVKTALLTVLLMLCMTVSAAAAYIGTGVVTGDALCLRSEPSTSSTVLTHLSKGTTLQVSESLTGWYKVSYNSKTGYVSADYINYTAATVITTADQSQTTTKTATIGGSSVNLRSAASTDSSVLAVLDKGAEVKLLSTEDGWCYVTYKDQAGYVKADYVYVSGVCVGDSRGVVTGNCVNLRGTPSTSGSILSRLYAGAEVELLSLDNGWYAVSYNGTSGYISADYVKPASAVAAASNGTVAAQIVELALSLKGTPYVYGGASTKGFDCSGFTMYVFKQFGYSLPHSATSQWQSSGTYVERSDLQPGDLVMFCDPSRSGGKACSHVGIYIGNDQFVHAASGSSGKYVRVDSLSSDYYNRYYKGAKRVA
jgi:cell wall-associated NlpC family hydrolase